MIGDQPAQLGHHLSLAAAAEVRGDAQLQRLDPGFLEPAALRADQRCRGNIRQGPAAVPQPEGLAQQAKGKAEKLAGDAKQTVKDATNKVADAANKKL